ncbi:MAG: iron-containing alcohol dehydrogenase [Candidatus Riflebacteria bacterium]|nr:iron-containing alcohol dehydrogenase [Candidatus Riflebacteria bacterium]
MNNIHELRKFVAPEFIFGVKARKVVATYAANLGSEKVLIVTDPNLIKAGWVVGVENSLMEAGIPYSIFSDVSPNPRATQVRTGAEFFIKEKCNAIIAIGGGSSVDCAKGIGIVAANGGDILDYEGVDEVPSPCAPLICIPSTSGASADVSQFAIISDQKRKVKIAIISKLVVPDLALIDPEVTTTMSRELTAFTGMDVLVHAIEAYVSNASSPITDLHAMQAIRLVRENLHLAVEHPENLDYRSRMMLASLHAGLAFSNASLGAVHAMAHSLGGYVDSPHGESNAILLDWVIDFNFIACPERFYDIAEIFGVKSSDCREDVKKQLCSRIAEFRKNIGINRTLSELGIQHSDLTSLAENALHDACLVTNPRDATLEDIVNIYEKALQQQQ